MGRSKSWNSGQTQRWLERENVYRAAQNIKGLGRVEEEVVAEATENQSVSNYLKQMQQFIALEVEREKLAKAQKEQEEATRRQVVYSDHQHRADCERYLEYQEYYDVAQDKMVRVPVEKYKYTDAEGRTFFKPPPPLPENKIKPVIHKAGHFPIGWMIEACERAHESECLIRIECETDAVVVIGENGEDGYATHNISWAAMENAITNPLILAIEHVERQIRVQSSLQKANG